MAIPSEFTPRFSGTVQFDYLRRQKIADQAVIRGTQIAVIPQNSKSPICGRLVDSSVNVNGLGGIPITPNTVGPGAITSAIYAAPLFAASPSIVAYANLQGLLQDFDCSPVFLNVPQDGSVARIAWAIRRSADVAPATPQTYPWVIQAETTVGGLPTPPVSQSLEYSYGQVALGNKYDLGAAYVSARGDIGPIAAFVTGYAPSGALAIPVHYLIGNTAYTPVISAGIPANSGYPNQTTASPAAPVVVASANGLSHAIQLNFQITNQPRDASLSRVSMWYRQVGDPTFSFYGSIRAAGVGLPFPSTGAATVLPIIGNYTFTYADLTAGTNFEFALSCEDARGDETAIVPFPTQVQLPVPASPSLANGSTNMVVDSAHVAPKYNGGKAGSSPLAYTFGFDGSSVFFSTPGNAGEAGDLGNYVAGTIAASGRRFYTIYLPMTVTPGMTYAYSGVIHAARDGGSAYLALVTPNGTNQGGTPSVIAGTTVTQSAGTNSRISGTWTCPAGVTSVSLILDSNSNTIGTGGYLYLSKPMFQQGSLSAYVDGPSQAPTGPVTQSIAISPAGTSAATAAGAPTITSAAGVPVSGSAATPVDQQPQGSLRVRTDATTGSQGLYTQTAATATSPTWSTITAGSRLEALSDVNVVDSSLNGNEVLTFIAGISAVTTSYVQSAKASCQATASPSTLSVALTNPPVAGHTMYAFIADDSDFSVTLPSGWVLAGTIPSGGGENQHLVIYQKTAVAADQTTAITLAGPRQVWASIWILEFVNGSVISQFTVGGSTSLTQTTASLAIPAGAVAIAGFGAPSSSYVNNSTGWTDLVNTQSYNSLDVKVLAFPTAGSAQASVTWGAATDGAAYNGYNNFIMYVTGSLTTSAWQAKPSVAGVSTLGALTDVDQTTQGAGKVLAATASGGKAFSFVNPTTGALTLAADTDIDFTTAGAGKILANVTSGTKPYSFIVPPTAGSTTLAGDTDIDFTTQAAGKILASVASGTKAFSFINPTTGATTLAADTDIDFTTAGAGKVLANVTSGGKPYSFITPAIGGGASTLAALTDVDATTKGAGKFLTYNSATAKFDFETPAVGVTGGTPTGAAVLPFYDQSPTTPGAFDDEFNATTLATKWAVINSTPGNTSRTITLPGDGKAYFDSPYTTTDRVFGIVQTAPTVAFTIIAKVGMSHIDSTLYAGPAIIIVGAAAVVQFQVVDDNLASPLLASQATIMTPGSLALSAVSSFLSSSVSPTSLYYKLTYDGTNYRFYVSTTGYFSAVNLHGTIAASTVGTISKIGVGMQPYGVFAQTWCDFFRVTTP